MMQDNQADPDAAVVATLNAQVSSSVKDSPGNYR
jgi:hypothetical protein